MPDMPDARKPVIRLVLDTNVVLDCLVFHDPAVASLVRALEDARAIAFVDRPCLEELFRVLGYPAFALDAQHREHICARYARLATPFEGVRRDTWLPRCLDPDDQKFLELARDVEADYLVTRDKALLALARPRRGLTAVRVVSPRDLPRFEPTGSGERSECARAAGRLTANGGVVRAPAKSWPPARASG